MKIRQKFLTVLSVLVAISVSVIPVFADEVIFNGPVFFSLGSLIAQGSLAGLGHRDVTVILDASGTPAVTCTDQAGHQIAGRNPQPVSAHGEQNLFSRNYAHGTSPFRVETGQPQPQSAVKLGCPAASWTAQITFVYWSSAVITVQETATHQTLLQGKFACHTTQNSVSCTQVH